MTEVISWNGDVPDAEVISTAVKVLRRGGLIVVPSETVYLILAHGRNQSSLAALKAISGLSEPPMTLAPDYKLLLDSFPARSVIRLANRFWPGPLTLVVPLDGNEVSIRVPRPTALRQLILASGCEIVATSAKLADTPPATDANQAKQLLTGRVDAILAGETAEYGMPSTVVKINESGAVTRILRHGAISPMAIYDTTAHKVCFVCTGNTCRSPAAEILFREKLAERLSVPVNDLAKAGYVSLSAGIAAFPGQPISEGSRITLEKLGYNADEHQSQGLEQNLLAEVDRIVVMTARHEDAINQRFPGHKHKVQLLDPDGISDPFGGTEAEYEVTITQISKAIDSLIERLL